jgi:cobalt-zinc-cadmium efflux system membrane fusion protein
MKLFCLSQCEARLALALSCCMAFGFTPAYADDVLTLGNEPIANLGVTLGKLTPVTEMPLLVAPAKVTIPSSREYMVSASQSGVITRLTVGVTDNVKKGQLLAQIDSPALLELQGQFLKANSILHLASIAYNRDKKLLNDGVIANRREQETSSQYNAAVLDVNQAKQLLTIAGMTDGEITLLNKNHRLNGQLSVYAPISGVVIERMSVAGTRVDNLTPLYRIANLDELWLDINIPQERIADIKIGDRVQIDNKAEVLPGQSVMPAIGAEISQIGSNVNPDNQTILVRARLKNSAAMQKVAVVRAGQKINVQIIQTSAQPAFSLPNTAIAQHEGKAVIFIRTDTGFTVRAVSVIGKQAENAIISGVLTGNEEVAVGGAAALKANWLGLGSGE